MFSVYTNNHHVSYPDVYRYWSPTCEQFAGGDCLLTMMRRGWILDDVVYAEEHWLSGARLVEVFYFELSLNDETMIMPVLSNPFVRRMITQERISIKSIEELRMQERFQHDADAA